MTCSATSTSRRLWCGRGCGFGEGFSMPRSARSARTPLACSMDDAAVERVVEGWAFTAWASRAARSGGRRWWRCRPAPGRARTVGGCGMVSAHSRSSVAEALIRLRAYAFAHEGLPQARWPPRWSPASFVWSNRARLSDSGPSWASLGPPRPNQRRPERRSVPDIGRPVARLQRSVVNAWCRFERFGIVSMCPTSPDGRVLRRAHADRSGPAGSSPGYYFARPQPAADLDALLECDGRAPWPRPGWDGVRATT